MNLIRGTLTNFMGHRSLTFEADGKNMDVLGDNGIGKTTIKSAFLWLVTDKDADGKEAEGNGGFKLKTLDATGKAIPMLDHSVEMVFDEKGNRFTLKKTMKENWVKKRNTSTQEFDGHVNSYEVDGVPRTKKEFDAFVGRICDGLLLRIMSDIDYFPSKMKWEDRRRLLMDLCENISDADVINATITPSNKALADLLPVVNAGRTIDDHRRVLAAQKTKLNSEIEMIPVRVDEATKALPDVSGLKAETLKAELEQARSTLQDTETKLLALSQGGAIAEKRLRIRTVQSEIIAKQNKDNEAQQSSVNEKLKELNELTLKKDALCRETVSKNIQIAQFTTDIAQLELKIVAKREEFNTENVKKFFPGTDEQTSCPACGQTLPEEHLQAARDKAQEQFNLKQSKMKTQIRNDGIALVARQTALKESLAGLEKQLPEIDVSINDLEVKIAAITAEINILQAATNKEESPAVAEMRKEVATIEAEIKKIETDAEPEQVRLTATRDSQRTVIASIESDIAKITQAESGTKRISELREQYKELKREYERLEHQVFLTEEFIRAKVGLFESRINSKFKVARFKLFDTQINGALNEVCEVLGPDGVPYSKGLNTAARINIGIDIVNTLSEHFGVTMPTFVDNAEAVTNIINTNSQLIRLIKPEIRNEEDRKKYSKLVIKTEGK